MRTMSTITVRQAILSDLDALVPLFDCYRQFYGRESDVGAAKAFLSARISLSTAITNEAAQALYNSSGWKRDEQFLVYHFATPA